MSNVISITTDCHDLYSVVLCHNRIKLFDSLTLRNVSDFNLKNLELEITSSPKFFNDFCARIGEISSGRYVRVSDIDLSVDTTTLSYLSTPLTSVVKISIKSQGEVLAEKSVQIQLLPYDYIPSLSSYPELLSAFVTPMQNEIRAIGDSVYKYLDDPSIPTNMDMWNKESRDISYSVIKAIYEAVRAQRITYNISPVLLDAKHTKVKLSETLLSYKNGNSLEISLLFASICEYVGYNSFVLNQSGKFFVGAFFTDKTFKAPIVDDSRPISLLNDGICDDFCILDPTTMVNGTMISFEDSAKMAHKSIDNSEFSVFVDISECRKNGIYPLHNRIHKDGNVIFEEVISRKNKDSLELPNDTQSIIKFVNKGFSERYSFNSLISVSQKRSAFLVGNGKSILTKFVFNSKVSLKSFSYPGVISQSFDNMLSTLLKLNMNADLSDVSDSVSTLYEKKDFDKRLIKLIDTEKSKNSLYLALGLVHGNAGETTVCSPLFLIPAVLAYDSKSLSFSLGVSKSSAVVNKAIAEYLNETLDIKLETEFSSEYLTEYYEEALGKLHSEVSKNTAITISDVCFLVKAPYENYLTSLVLSHEYFENSNISNILGSSKDFKSNSVTLTTPDEMQPGFFEMPLSLDSSQANAYNTVLQNDCTVVLGPNGSGKTRVASSVAHNAVKHDMSVLYVSDSNSNLEKFKQYASDSGLSDFTFYVSKNNFQKNSFEIGAVETVLTDKASLFDSINKSHSYLSNYFSALHKVREIGFSLYEAISQYERYKTFPYAVNFINEDVAHLSRDDVVRWFDVVSNLAKAGADCHEPYNNPLMYVRLKEFSYDIKSKALVALAEYKDISYKFVECQNRVADYLGIEAPIIKEEQTVSLVNLIELFSENIDYVFPRAFLSKAVSSEFIRIESFLENGKDFFETKKFLDEYFSPDVLGIDADSLLNDWRNASMRFAITKASAQNSVKNKLKVYAKDHKLITTDNTAELLGKIANYKIALDKISEISDATRKLFGIDLNNEISKDNDDVFGRIEKCIIISKEYNSLLYDVYGADNKPEDIYSHNDSQLANKEKFSRELSALYSEFQSLHEKNSEIESKLEEILLLDIKSAKKDNSKIWYYFTEKFIDRMLDNIDLLKHWCAWNKEKDKAVASGLSGVVSLYTGEQMSYNDIKNAFLKGFFKTVSEYILSCETEINNFSKERFEDEQSRLIELAEEWRDISNKEFASSTKERINTKTKSEFDVEIEDAIKLLKRDFSFNDKFYNISSRSKEILKTIKPCIASKGTSVFSQFGKMSQFDLLIIDTAEDFSENELILMLPIAKKAVIFAENASSNKLVSLLCNRGVPCVSLSWIYTCNFCTRLVNKLFYPENTSYVFPDKARRGMRIIRQKGTYDRKNTRTNFIEASAVVDEIMKKIDVGFSSSLAVIAMTEEQASLIELLFTKRLQSLTESQKKVFFDRKEPFFITSLDKMSFTPCNTVIFSTTFSIEEKPKYKDTISRFIPELCNENAEKNLINTLLCAQDEFVLATSLTEEVLDKFTTVIPEYCMFKRIMLHLCDTSDSFDSEMNKAPRIENSVIRQVINHIEAQGYQADIDVGTNCCRIDIAVKRKNEDGYLFGIIFDESSYLYGGDLISRALIQRNLEQKSGWKILRIYTVEWFENSPKQLDEISDMLSDKASLPDSISFDVL